MKFKKLSLLLILSILIVACKSNPINTINDQITKMRTTNNSLIQQINKLTAYDNQLQEAFETDLNGESVTLETSKMNELLKTRESEISEYDSHLESFTKRLTEMKDLNVENLEKGQTDFESIKSSLDSLSGLYAQTKQKITELFDSERQLINVTIAADPSIQELQDSLKNVNLKNTEFYGLLSQLKSSELQLDAHISSWEKALEMEPTEDSEVAVDTPEEAPVVQEPQPEVTEPPKVTYTVTDDFRVASIEPNEKPLVLLTFDDSVQPEPDSYTLSIAKTLKEKGVSAIFFFNGMHLESDFGKEVLKQVYDMGFTIGNHTYSHPYLNELNYEDTKSEIVKTNELIESVTGEKPKIFRPSFGIMGDSTQQVLDEEGMIWMNWTYGYDWEEEYMNADSLANIMVNTEFLSDGANLLMHDRQWTSAAIGKIVDGLVAKGYEIVNPNEIQTQGDTQ